MSISDVRPNQSQTLMSSYLAQATAERSPNAQPMENVGSVLKPVTSAGKLNQTHSSTERKPQVSTSRRDTDASQAEQASDKQEQLETRQRETQQQRIEQQQIQALAARDREVRNHERAHAAVGGQYAGAPRYQYERGPDGINYAVAGEVSISTGSISSDPQATIEKAQVIRRAALAPAEPSAQDRKVAAEAMQMEAEARIELADLVRQERLAEQEALSEQRARDISSALDALDAALAGETDFDRHFADLVNREPELPEHLRKELDRG